jgi:hypothetical protein
LAHQHHIQRTTSQSHTAVWPASPSKTRIISQPSETSHTHTHIHIHIHRSPAPNPTALVLSIVTYGNSTLHTKHVALYYIHAGSEHTTKSYPQARQEGHTFFEHERDPHTQTPNHRSWKVFRNFLVVFPINKIGLKKLFIQFSVPTLALKTTFIGSLYCRSGNTLPGTSCTRYIN